MNSRVHPTYKTRYRVDNWPANERKHVRRGDNTLWLTPDAIESWKAVPSGQRGSQKRFSDTAIETALMLRLLFHLPLRHAPTPRRLDRRCYWKTRSVTAFDNRQVEG